MKVGSELFSEGGTPLGELNLVVGGVMGRRGSNTIAKEGGSTSSGTKRESVVKGGDQAEREN